MSHQGVKKINEKIRINFHWDGMNKTVNEYVNSCLNSQHRARKLKRERVPINVVPRSEVPFVHLYMDIIGPLVEGAEYPFFLVLIDSCTVHAFRLHFNYVKSQQKQCVNVCYRYFLW